MERSLRLLPEMGSRKLLVLTFIRSYIGRWGGSPSISEIAAGTGADRNNIKWILRVLAEEGAIVRRPGARGIALPDKLAEAVRELRAAGYVVDDDVVRGPFPTLPMKPVLDYDPG